MSQLEDLRPNATVKFILPDALVTVVTTQWIGSEALELTYKTAAGKVANELLYHLARVPISFKRWAGEKAKASNLPLGMDDHDLGFTLNCPRCGHRLLYGGSTGPDVEKDTHHYACVWCERCWKFGAGASLVEDELRVAAARAGLGRNTRPF